ncbi:MAG TPA: DNA alkylation repair protein [Marinilabiliaceae bacterium]|nr:DNA alkylation repair protein [Marinilabiliaceae bacterium]
MKEKLLAEIRQALQSSADPQAKATSARFFKPGEAALVYGVKNAEATKIIREYLKRIKPLSKPEVFALCDELWQSKYLEEAIIACRFAESLVPQYEPEDFKTFERWVNSYVNNWADCDTLCNHTIGSFVMKYPEYLEELKRWATSPHRWTKRGASVSLIIPARKGLFLKEIFEIADLLLLDKDDLVQKGYGWMLKAASESNQQAVFNYVVAKKALMPRTALRYAIEKMPKELKAEAMKK